jgi:outer membrane lipoprotein carrier protein
MDDWMNDTHERCKRIFAAFLGILFFLIGTAIPCRAEQPPVEEILKRVEARYAGEGFSAHFFQTSVITAMDITETAAGLVQVKRPNKMRWTYEKPKKQLIVTDGKTLWIFKANDNQVSIGAFPEIFGEGKGAGFLANIQQIRKSFDVSLQETNASGEYVLKLVPLSQKIDLAYVLLNIDPETYDIVEIRTLNTYKDETRIELTDIQRDQHFEDSLFQFTVPQGAEIIRMDEPGKRK